METITSIVNVISANWAGLLEAVAFVVLAASVVIKLIPTLDPNNRFLPFVKWAAKYLALDNGRIPDDDRPVKKN